MIDLRTCMDIGACTVEQNKKLMVIAHQKPYNILCLSFCSVVIAKECKVNNNNLITVYDETMFSITHCTLDITTQQTDALVHYACYVKCSLELCTLSSLHNLPMQFRPVVQVNQHGCQGLKQL